MEIGLKLKTRGVYIGFSNFVNFKLSFRWLTTFVIKRTAKSENGFVRRQVIGHLMHS